MKGMSLNGFLWFVFALFLQLTGSAQTASDSSAPQNLTTKASYSAAIKRLAPAVVNVYSSKKVMGKSPALRDPMLRDFFKDSASQTRVYREEDLGSGVIISQDGYILTNNHVVDDVQEVQLVLADEREFTARVIGTDVATDLAVLKIDATNLPVAELGNSDESEIGDVVLAIGNPFGVGQTVTMGIISATDRGGFGIVDYEDFIQIDAAINPGNSGGALCDTRGRVIGINTAMLANSGHTHGIGFAVPINLARYVVQQIIREGRVVRGTLGLSVQPLTPGLARHFGVSGRQGALIDDVAPQSPAAQAGLIPGDVVIQYNGSKVTNPRNLRMNIGKTRPGTKAALTVLRDGVELTMVALPREVPSPPKKFVPLPVSDQTQPDVLNGVTVTDLVAENRKRLQIAPSIKGALVLNVDTDSAAFAAGLRQGDVIEEINHQPTKDSYQAVAISRKAINDDEMLLRVWCRGKSHYLNVSKNIKSPQPPPTLSSH